MDVRGVVERLDNSREVGSEGKLVDHMAQVHHCSVV